MASIISPKNVGKLMIATAVASETTNSTFNSGASIGEVAVIKADGAAAAANLPFKVVLKKSTALTGVEFSDTVDPKQIDFVKLGVYQAEQAKVVTVSGFTGTAMTNVTYRVSIKKFDGIQSPENFRFIHGFYVTPPTGTMPAYSVILASLRDQLNSELRRNNENGEIVVTVSGTTLVFTGQVQTATIGRDSGDPVEFTVEVSVKDNSPATLATADYNYPILTVTNTTPIKPGVGTGKQVALTEYALWGYETGDYGREMGYPNNFTFTSRASVAANYNTIVIGFHKDREGVNVERQFKEFTIVFPYTNLASNANTNAFLAKLRVVAPNIDIPADLAEA